MTTKKEDERNEKVIRGLLKLPPNRKCINCNSLGPQYVCINFWTFICVTCSGIHREFTHRVKSISMAKFTSQEVEALQRGGNQRAREIFLADWDTELSKLPDSSNLDKLREFIKSVYVDKKYASTRSFDKPPRDIQVISNHNHKNHEDHRRASSYHSFSQSPPYEDQYEEKYRGKKMGILTRKPGSDHSLYEGKFSSFMYSPAYQGMQQPQDRLGNETPNSRNSDCSVTSGADSSIYDSQSLNIQDNGHSSPTLQVRDILVQDKHPPVLNPYSGGNNGMNSDGFQRSQRTASSSSFGSFDSNSVSSFTPSSSSNIIDLVLQPENSSLPKHSEISVTPSLIHISVSTHIGSQDSFSPSIMEQPVPSLDSFTDLFAVNQQPSSTIISEVKEISKPFSQGVGWATFDIPHQANTSSELNLCPPVVSQANIHPFPKNTSDSLSLFFENQDWDSMPSVAVDNSQTWDAFGLSEGGFQPTSFQNISQTSEAQVLAHDLIASEVLYTNLKDQEGGVIQERKSTNPFDLPFDSEFDVNNKFLDMSQLQNTLPNSLLHTDLLGGFPQTWFPQNPDAPYVPPIPQGSLKYNGGEMPSSQLREITSQGSLASIGGNPFA
ncbi:probable ADP-ribosylation factor GTPase-activating protein AGD14 isoform X1 [Zingiber officinale]|uniref:probable ADP-ribosylation factor GTPase-activating protein AGD14 isoform X1 n=1 Tax=Zingiber officinale TaxID=94328 RepID=UPI001C4DCD8E|nr:probable ADP-ribosylation factor GTPase-activating protein AGD14 isoform X1 [Zingiber officinale]XP_042411669.1 probable ADP-ribosylation factor GTPase-activating protein AGD14 isoform X1 [Zingiber officinale]XP_042411670.1 probable ADP-ribosylation factor GTPase-activating protein AGD14 isoform X1 [Zingiber officinale]XP_042411671.1 probable ADP-ribosylation factor GTPase-activating protein AGD14 isoform X1 [Zingiber officinale]XP_042411672.1 probable ADP-ribosylation factor GTPase-activati